MHYIEVREVGESPRYILCTSLSAASGGTGLTSREPPARQVAASGVSVCVELGGGQVRYNYFK